MCGRHSFHVRSNVPMVWALFAQETVFYLGEYDFFRVKKQVSGGGKFLRARGSFFALRTQFPLREKHYSIRGGGLSCVRRCTGVCAVSGRRFIRSSLQASFSDFWETSLFQRAFLVLGLPKCSTSWKIR